MCRPTRPAVRDARRAPGTAPARASSSAPVVQRPGEQVQIGTARLDIMAVLEDGSLGRPELTIAVDVAMWAALITISGYVPVPLSGAD